MPKKDKVALLAGGADEEDEAGSTSRSATPPPPAATAASSSRPSTRQSSRAAAVAEDEALPGALPGSSSAASVRDGGGGSDGTASRRSRSSARRLPPLMPSAPGPSSSSSGEEIIAPAPRAQSEAGSQPAEAEADVETAKTTHEEKGDEEEDLASFAARNSNRAIAEAAAAPPSIPPSFSALSFDGVGVADDGRGAAAAAARNQVKALRYQVEHEQIDAHDEIFAREVDDEVLMIGSVPLEEVEERERLLEADRVAELRDEAARHRARLEAVALREAHAKRGLAAVAAAERRELRNRERRLVRRHLHQAKDQQEAFRKAETKLRGALTKAQGQMKAYFGDLEEADDMYGAVRGRRYKVDWALAPRLVRLRVDVLRAVKNKLPRGRYAVMVTLYDRLGGHPLRWSKLQGVRWTGSTPLPQRHTGKFFSQELNFSQKRNRIFLACPSVEQARPSMVFVFEVFLLRGAHSKVDKVVGWGAFPMALHNFDVIQGRFKVPLLRGEMDPTLDKFESIERHMAANLDTWLCNLYFDVRHLPRYINNQKEYEVELNFTSSLLRLARRADGDGHESNSDGSDDEDEAAALGGAGAIGVGDDDESDSESDQSSASETEDSSGSASGSDSDEEGRQERGGGAEAADEEEKAADGGGDGEDKAAVSGGGLTKSSSGDAAVVAAAEDSKREPSAASRSGKEAEPLLPSPPPPSTPPPPRASVLPSAAARPGKQGGASAAPPQLRLSLAPEKKAQLAGGAPAGRRLYELPPKDAKVTVRSTMHRGLFREQPEWDAAPELGRKVDPVKRAKQLDRYTFSVVNVDRDVPGVNSAGEKMRYLGSEVLMDLGLNRWRTVEFWAMLLLLAVLFWFRLYVHCLGQYLYLKSMRVAVFEFEMEAAHCELGYSTDTVEAITEMGVVAMGVLSNIMVFTVLLALSVVAQHTIGRFPDTASRFLLSYGVMTVLDPLLVLVSDLARQNWAGDSFKLYNFFERTEGNGVSGIFLTVIVTSVLLVMSVFLVYNYVLHVHMNGRMLDVYFRLHGNESNFFVPDDLELSTRTLRWILNKSRRWTGFHGATRKISITSHVMKDHLDPSYFSRTIHLALYTQDLYGERELYRHFVRRADGAIIEMFDSVELMGAENYRKLQEQLLCNPTSMAGAGASLFFDGGAGDADADKGMPFESAPNSPRSPHAGNDVAVTWKRRSVRRRSSEVGAPMARHDTAASKAGLSPSQPVSKAGAAKRERLARLDLPEP